MLYKFFTVNEYSLNALRNSCLWFSKVSKFNDPFEGQIKIINGELTDSKMVKLIQGMNSEGHLNSFLQIGKTNETLTKLAGILINSKGDELKEIIINVARNAFNKVREDYLNGGACCFSSGVDSQGNYNNPLENKLMWGHYGDGLRGFALKLKDDIFSHARKNSKEESISGPYKINYIKEYPCINLIYLSHTLYVYNDKFAAGDYLNRLVSSKSEEWKYEMEVRFLSPIGDELYKFNSDSIESLCIGEKMPDSQVKCLLAIAKQIGIKSICRAKLGNENYSIEFEHEYYK
ncbi:Protein of uncharacterised function (DUF2971) [Yersinia pseudotuberculosis]|uniref:DUF2971 domain-containing protein n=2 Tax=Yersinia pseudotuberculosis complex TaxID=1649845 RepID=UPI0005E5D13A|nr:DUF2971 domain-containing protein [Yersinia pseudotuberculosis]CNL45364.1 Protein of uncharacterised function (DUF2971) [Yersinia pseudotuberculosis]